jgi:transcriptional regulator with XRE-family HTH domain
METSDRIKLRMRELGLKGVDITRSIGVSSGGVSQWTQGLTTPNGKRLFALAKLLQCDPSWLITGVGNDGNAESHDTTDLSAINARSIAFRVPLIPKDQISKLQFDSNHSDYKDAGPIASVIAAHFKASKRSFAYIEDINSMRYSAPTGSMILVDPERKIDLSKPSRIYLFQVKERFFLGELSDTPNGLLLRFQNNAPGWEPIPVQQEDFVAGFLGSISAESGVVIR